MSEEFVLDLLLTLLCESKASFKVTTIYFVSTLLFYTIEIYISMFYTDSAAMTSELFPEPAAFIAAG